MPSSVFITGAGRGIRLALTKRFGDSGWVVYAGARNPEQCPELAALAQNSDGTVHIVPLDVRKSAQRANAAALVGGQLDVLINNAGVWGQLPSHFGQTDVDAWLNGYQVNVISAMQMMEAMQPALCNSNNARIVNVTSAMGSIADNRSGGFYAYRASKAALNAVTGSAAIDLRDQRICVICAHPGWVRTEMGGEQAPLDTCESAAGLHQLIENLRLVDSGKFLNYDGSPLPW